MSELLSYKGTADSFPRCGSKPDGYQTNSSTFGTLLSSQGSSAHLSAASRPGWGATWWNLPVGACRVKSALAPPAPRRDRRSELSWGRLCAHSVHLGWGDRCGVSLRGRPPGLSALRPAAPWRHGEHYAALRRASNRPFVARATSDVPAGQRHFSVSTRPWRAPQEGPLV